MQTITISRTPAVRVDEAIRGLLRRKGYAVWSTVPDANVYRAIELMSDKQVGALVVTSEGQLVGIVSERDYARKVILKGRDSRTTLVREVMNTPGVVRHAGPHD